MTAPGDPIAGLGTPEERWAAWPALTDLPRRSAAELLGGARRLVVLSPHPDDETLAASALLRGAAAASLPVLLVAVSDGTASHPGSARWSPGELAAARPAETRDALAALGVAAAEARLGLPDGEVAGADVLAGLRDVLADGDLVATTWRHDGHPDHEAAGLAAATVAAERGLALVEMPVWTWHWAQPADPRVPWQSLVRIDLSAADLAAKRAAIRAYRSQVEPDDALLLGAVLPAGHLARLTRSYELYLPAPT